MTDRTVFSPDGGDPYLQANGVPAGPAESAVTAPVTGSTPVSRRAAREAAARNGHEISLATGAIPVQSMPATVESQPFPKSPVLTDVPPVDQWTLRRPVTVPIPVVQVESATPHAAPTAPAPTSQLRGAEASHQEDLFASEPDLFDAMVAPISSEHHEPPRERKPAERATSARQNEGDEAEEDLGDLFTSGSDDAQGPPRRKKRGRGCLIGLLIMLVLLGGVAAGAAWAWNEYGDKISDVMGWGPPKDFEPGMASGEVYVTIYDNDTGFEVSTALYEAGVTKTESVFYDMLLKSAPNKDFYPGVYRLQKQMTAADALAALEDDANKLENSVVFPEGLTVTATLERISEALGMSLDDLTAAAGDPASFGVDATSLEGWLFPAMYEFGPDVSAHDVIATLVDRTRTSLREAGVPDDDAQRVLTIASIIQREARYERDFYQVSRVIQNRLKESNQETHGLLQMDSTAQYGFGELHAGSASTSSEAQYDDNPWNTYVHPGLPVGPIANPGDLAIDAAMHPEDGPWLYFVTVNLDTGETIFTNTYDEHLVYVEQMQEWCSAHPDSGC